MRDVHVLLHGALKKRRRRRRQKEAILEHNRKLGRLDRKLIPVGLNSGNEF